MKKRNTKTNKQLFSDSGAQGSNRYTIYFPKIPSPLVTVFPSDPHLWGLAPPPSDSVVLYWLQVVGPEGCKCLVNVGGTSEGIWGQCTCLCEGPSCGTSGGGGGQQQRWPTLLQLTLTAPPCCPSSTPCWSFWILTLF